MPAYIKKITAVIISAVIYVSAVTLVYAAGEGTDIGFPSVSAESAILIKASDNEIIFEKNANVKRSMASTTKIMTAVVALENADLTDPVQVSKYAVGIEGSSIYLYADEKLSMEDLVYALMLESANDAAAAIAIEVAGSVDKFAGLMNEKAAELGLADTHFTNPHGLDNPDHYTTAYDLAILTSYALKNKQFRTIVSTYKRVIPLKNGEGARLLLNHNKLIKQYPGSIGVKTGYTKKSGRCLVSAAERDGVMLIAVTLNAPDDWSDHKKMLDWGFDHFENILLAENGSLSYTMPVVGGTVNYVKCRNVKDLYATIEKSDNKKITSVKEMNRFYYAPIYAGEELGRVIFYNDGEAVGIAPIIAENDVPGAVYKKTIWDLILGLLFRGKG